MQKVIQIRNLDCAVCAMELQEELARIDGISSPVVDFVTQRVSFACDGQASFEKAIFAISHFEEVEIIDGNAPKKKERYLKELISLAVSTALFLPALVLRLAQIGSEWIVFGLFLGAFLAAGWSVAINVGKNFIKAFRGGFHPSLFFDENLLMLVASIGAFALKEGMEGAVVMLLYQIGELLQSVAVGKSRGAIEKLVQLQSDCATLVEGDTLREVLSQELKNDDLVFIRRGDKVPADCILVEGDTQMDTKSLTGEAVYREVCAGDELLSGFVNVGNAVKARVLRPSNESAVAKILDLVENATSKKAKPEKFITRFARIYTPVVVLCALLVAVVPPLFQGYNFGVWVARALNLLIISCPCALVISVPLTYFSGVGALAKCGVLVKGATYLDVLAKIKAVAFDKTGTLTEGKFIISKIHGDNRALELGALLESNSSHPLAQAFQGVKTSLAVEGCEEIAGKGLVARVDGKEVLVGSERFLQENGVAIPSISTLSALVFVAEEKQYLGAIEIEDEVRKNAKEALLELKRTGISQIVVLTGDSEARAKESLKELPVDEICAQLLPDEKPACARRLKENGQFLFVGDGINDTPVMAESDIAVAMGGLGSDVAIEASDMVLASDNLSALPKAMKVAKKTRRIVFENIIFSLLIKLALIVLSVLGLLPLWIAVLGDVGVMLLAVLNSLRNRAKIK